ncbi:MAG TPA: Stk1 family PASTA domain-containing Ser/Thr kinase [Clostridia bacterium]|nr:Stk1 family PASTA domain-containing Ser/Thr kinase [Clostridia bacterium]
MIGKVLGKRYEIVEKIGGGGMALVYRAKCQLLNRYVAIKVLRSEFINDRNLLDKFKKESQSAASLSHPNIVNVYDVGEEDNIHYIVMEYVEGKTLEQLIKEKGKLSTSEIVDLTKQIALALKHAHSNHIIHRDIKPHNILITEDGRAKVTDFGIALAATSSTITNAGSIIGSVHYFAPEQARGGYTDEKSDLYSLGIVMYEMATGRLPFDGDAPVTIALKHIQEKPELPSEYNPSISKDLEAIIMKLIQKEQSARYAGATDLIEDLYKIKSNIELGNIDNTLKIEDSPTQVIPPVTVNEIKELMDNDHGSNSENRPHKKNKRHKLLVGSAVVAALVAALLFTFGILHLADFFKVEDVEMPNFVGWNIQDAEKEAERIGLRLNVSLANDNNIPKDKIIKQDIPEEMIVRKNTVVKVTVSRGSKLAIVPYLIYEDAVNVKQLLEDKGLEVGTVREEFSELPIGTVISQDPEDGKEVPQGTKVNCIVSKGLEKSETVFMPGLVGKSLEEAKDIITQNRLKLAEGPITEKHSDIYIKGYVIEQSIPSNTEVDIGAVVSLVVSKGSDAPDQMEDPDGHGQNEGEQPDPNETSTTTIVFTLTQHSGEVDVVIEQMDGDKGKRIYSKKHDLDKEGKVISVPVNGTGQQEYAIYVNGELFGTKKISF